MPLCCANSGKPLVPDSIKCNLTVSRKRLIRLNQNDYRMPNWATLNVPQTTKDKVRDLADVMDVSLGEVGATAIDQLYGDVIGNPDEPQIHPSQFEEDERGDTKEFVPLNDKGERQERTKFQL